MHIKVGCIISPILHILLGDCSISDPIFMAKSLKEEDDGDDNGDKNLIKYSKCTQIIVTKQSVVKQNMGL